MTAGHVRLPARPVLPEAAQVVIVLMHGSGSGRDTPHDRHVAGVLDRPGLGTELLDPLTAGRKATSAAWRQRPTDPGQGPVGPSAAE
ncbi:hypothetical protein WB401_13710 [Streptomyces brasiliscabiei]|uniref:hypothetical protein n=1 Tax=Streptomyces brasiliscabiei TaxID=2736302 RepID=UPI003014B66A